MQLESQISHASEFIAGRDTSNDSSENPTNAVLSRLDRLENKLANLCSASPANNIVINTCQSENTNLKQISTTSTQTDVSCIDRDEEAPPTAQTSHHSGGDQEEMQASPTPSL